MPSVDLGKHIRSTEEILEHGLFKDVDVGDNDYYRSLPTKDLLWSGQIEQDADFIMLIHNTDKKSEFIIDKNRDGQLAKIDMFFKKNIVRFYETQIKE